MHTADVLEASNVQELEIPSDSTQLYNLCDVEIETVRRAAFDRGLPFAAGRRSW